MAVSSTIKLDALPFIYPSVELAPKGALIQCRLRKEDVPIVGLRGEVYDHAYGRNFAGVITLEGPKKGLIPQGQFYCLSAFVSSLLSINVNIGFLYLESASKAVWMWSEFDDMLSWICIIPTAGLVRGQMERSLMLSGLLELGEPVLRPIEKQIP
jgi:hypothetical protein